MFTLTKRGKQKLLSYLQDMEYPAIPIITWSSELRNGSGEWIVGFIESERVSSQGMESCKHVIDDIEFVIDGPNEYLELLDNVALDDLSNRLQFTQRSPGLD